MIAIALRGRTNPLVATGGAFRHAEPMKSERLSKTSTCVLSPFWAPNYVDSSQSVRREAGVEHVIMNARYQEPRIGRFVSEDPSHLALGDAKQLKQLTGQDLKAYLTDPQQLNSYSYVENNPLTKTDPTGQDSEFAFFQQMRFANQQTSGLFARQLQSEMQGQQQAVRAVGTGLVVTGLAAGTVMAPEFAPISTRLAYGMAVSGVADAGFLAYQDLQDSSMDSSLDRYIANYGTGALTAGSVKPLGKFAPLIVGPATNALEGWAYDGKANTNEVVASGVGNIAGVGFETAMSTSPVGRALSPVAGAVTQGALEFGATVFTFDALNTRSNNRNYDK